jgi:hypothetical protein
VAQGIDSIKLPVADYKSMSSLPYRTHWPWPHAAPNPAAGTGGRGGDAPCRVPAPDASDA